MWSDPEALEPVVAVLERSGYRPFSSPGDRHGSWEWRFSKDSGDLTRFVILAATPVGRGETLDVELWIGAEADQKFTRQRVESVQMKAAELPRKSQDLSMGAERAAARANSLSMLDLR